MKTRAVTALACALVAVLPSACGRLESGLPAASPSFARAASPAGKLRAREHALPAGSQAAAALTAGPGRAVWYVDSNAEGVGKAAGSRIVYYRTLKQRFGSASAACQFTGDGQHVWFAAALGEIVALNGSGTPVARYPLRDSRRRTIVPDCLAIASDGTLWFTSSRLGFVTHAGHVTTMNGIGLPSKIAAPSGPNAYYCNADTLAHNVVVKVGRSGTLAQYPMPPGLDFCSAIVAGPDGNLWLADAAGAAIAKMTPAGGFRLYSLRPAFPRPVAIAGLAVGADGNLWEAGSGKTGLTLARITTAGAVSAYQLGTLPVPTAIAARDDRTLWLNAPSAAKLYSVALPR